MTLNILGTEYKVMMVDSRKMPDGFGGFCDPDLHTIEVVRLETLDAWKDEPARKRTAREKEFLRHEIVHAFFNESGLKDNCINGCDAWARNEEMVDWFAIQGPKIYKVWKEAGAL